MTVVEFTKWLLEKFPEDARLVSTNSLAWFNNEVKVLKDEEIAKIFRLMERPEVKQEPTGFPCLVVYDERRYDY